MRIAELHVPGPLGTAGWHLLTAVWPQLSCTAAQAHLSHIPGNWHAQTLSSCTLTLSKQSETTSPTPPFSHCFSSLCTAAHQHSWGRQTSWDVPSLTQPGLHLAKPGHRHASPCQLSWSCFSLASHVGWLRVTLAASNSKALSPPQRQARPSSWSPLNG